MSSKKIVFMGTPDFALPTLQKLIKSEHQIVAVYTAVPKPSGRGKSLTKSKTHQLAELENLTVFTPQSLKNESLPECDVAVVAAYGILLPSHVLQSPKYGCINIHPSSLPRWRGAAPIQRTIMAGDKETAICIMKMDEGLDTGDILLQRKFDLDEKITAGELHDKCANIGAEMILEVIGNIENLKAQKQHSEGITYARKITRDDELINWAEPAKIIAQQIRGLTPFPGAYFKYKSERIKVFETELVDKAGKPGELLDDKLLVACGDSALRILKLQRPGKRVMTADEMLRGFLIPKGTKI